MCVVGTTIMIVGVREKGPALKELPIRLLLMDTAAQAIQCLKTRSVNAIASRWHLMDVPDGGFLKAVLGADPWMPTVAFVRPGDLDQEIAARQIGATAVFSEDVEDACFRDAICQILQIEEISSIALKNEYESTEEPDSRSLLPQSWV